MIWSMEHPSRDVGTSKLLGWFSMTALQRYLEVLEEEKVDTIVK